MLLPSLLLLLLLCEVVVASPPSASELYLRADLSRLCIWGSGRLLLVILSVCLPACLPAYFVQCPGQSSNERSPSNELFFVTYVYAACMYSQYVLYVRTYVQLRGMDKRTDGQASKQRLGIVQTKERTNERIRSRRNVLHKKRPCRYLLVCLGAFLIDKSVARIALVFTTL